MGHSCMIRCSACDYHVWLDFGMGFYTYRQLSRKDGIYKLLNSKILGIDSKKIINDTRRALTLSGAILKANRWSYYYCEKCYKIYHFFRFFVSHDSGHFSPAYACQNCRSKSLLCLDYIESINVECGETIKFNLGEFLITLTGGVTIQCKCFDCGAATKLYGTDCLWD